MIRVMDNTLSVYEAQLAWPDEAWDGWVKEDKRYTGKWVSAPGAELPRPCGVLLARMAELMLGVPDLSLWAGGLHEMRPGSSLPRHLDANTHPRLGLRRYEAAVLFVSYHHSGGELVLETSGVTVAPKQNRLVMFKCQDEVHRVAEVREWPRRTLVLFSYFPHEGGDRTRADFSC